MSKQEIMILELTVDEVAYVTYCIGFTYQHMSEYQRDIVKGILGKISRAGSKEVKR